MSNVILETRNLTKEFKGFTAVSEVNLKVERGHIHALIGPNGAGKTTCFNLLTKFLVPTGGQILFNGKDITAAKPAQIARMGVIRSFQISAVFPHLSVLQNVRIGLQRQLGTSFHFWKSERSLSQLNDRAMGMGHEDVHRVTELIKKVSAGRTILMVEHNMNVVSGICDKISVLQRGAMLAEGSYAEVSRNPQVMEAYMGTTHAELEGAH
eukprot:gene5475-6331_t